MITTIRFFGVDSPTGIGTHCSQTVKALQSFQLEKIKIELIPHYDLEKVQHAINCSRDNDIHVFFFPESYAHHFRGQKIYWCVFDSSRPSPGYLGWLDIFDYIFATSNWCRDTLIHLGLNQTRIVVVPEGVDAKFYHPYDRPKDRNSAKTKFLMVGKYEQKKGYREAFEAIDIATSKNANVELLTKSDWVNGTNATLHPEFIQLVNKYQSKFSIVVYSGNFSRDQMRMLYYSCDYFLHPSRCEGWSLPLIEAIACGSPCITTQYGGHSEYLGFLSEQEFIRTTLKPVDCDTFKSHYDHGDGDFGLWAYPEVHDLAERIVLAASSPTGVNWLGSDNVRVNFSWDKTAEKILKTLLTHQLI